MRGSPERDISSLRALGPGGGQISRVVHVSTRAAFGVFAEKSVFLQKSREWLIGPVKGSEGGGGGLFFVLLYFGTETRSRRGGRGFKRFMEAVGFILAKFEPNKFYMQIPA